MTYHDDFPEQSFNEVPLKGQSLHPVLWQGKQWAITSYGLERRNGCYAISLDDLYRRPLWQWARHLESKAWVDPEDLADALEALELLYVPPGVRTDVQAPFCTTADEVEAIALKAADQVYQSVKRAYGVAE